MKPQISEESKVGDTVYVPDFGDGVIVGFQGNEFMTYARVQFSEYAGALVPTKGEK